MAYNIKVPNINPRGTQYMRHEENYEKRAAQRWAHYEQEDVNGKLVITQRNVIKLRKRVLDAMYEESKTLFANIFVNILKKVLTNQEKCAAVFAISENGPCN